MSSLLTCGEAVPPCVASTALGAWVSILATRRSCSALACREVEDTRRPWTKRELRLSCLNVDPASFSTVLAHQLSAAPKGTHGETGQSERLRRQTHRTSTRGWMLQTTQ